MERVLKNADISILSNFLAIFSNFFLHIEKFCQVLYTCQISDQLDHLNRNYGGGGAESALPRPYQSANCLACLWLKDDQFYLLVRLLLSLLCFHIQKHLISHALAISLCRISSFKRRPPMNTGFEKGINAAHYQRRSVKCPNAALITKIQSEKAALIGRKAQKVIFYIFIS